MAAFVLSGAVTLVMALAAVAVTMGVAMAVMSGRAVAVAVAADTVRVTSARVAMTMSTASMMSVAAVSGGSQNTKKPVDPHRHQKDAQWQHGRAYRQIPDFLHAATYE